MLMLCKTSVVYDSDVYINIYKCHPRCLLICPNDINPNIPANITKTQNVYFDVPQDDTIDILVNITNITETSIVTSF